jgi:preprotein translocase subunit YajC
MQEQTVDKSIDTLRSKMVFLIIGLLFLTIVVAFGGFFVILWRVQDANAATKMIDSLKGLVTSVLPSEVGLVGSIVGFYFGVRSQENRAKST